MGSMGNSCFCNHHADFPYPLLFILCAIKGTPKDSQVY